MRVETPRALMEFAVDAAREAGEITLEYFQKSFETDYKSDNSPVTIADRRAERTLRARIEAAFPSHAILGEEEGVSGPADASFRWIVDPIDGTQSFVRGVALYGVMVAVAERGVPIAGVVLFPALREIVYAANGEGCYWNDDRARVSSVGKLAEAMVLATDLSSMQKFGRGGAYERLRAASKIQRTWGDCYGHMLVATGRAEVMLDPIMSVWDCAALKPIVEEAGGSFTDWKGAPWDDATEAISTNGLVLDEVIGLIGSEPPPR